MSNAEFKSSKPAIHRIEGSTETRRSPRYYTHAVVGDYDRPAQIESIAAWTTNQAKDTWKFNHAKASAEAGKPVTFPAQYKNTPPIVLRFEQSEIEKAQDFITSNPNLDAFILVSVTDAIERFCSTPDGTLRVLQWSLSEKNAIKASTSKIVQRNALCRNVRVVKVQRG